MMKKMNSTSAAHLTSSALVSTMPHTHTHPLTDCNHYLCYCNELSYNTRLVQVSYRVTHVVLSNRQECCRCPLAGAKIYIGDPSALNLALNENPDLSTESNWQLCATVSNMHQ